MAPEKRYCVFRIVNEARKEIFLAATTRSIFDAIADIRRSRPRALRDWDLTDITMFESLEFDLTENAARAFVEARVRKGAQRGYCYILDLGFGGRKG